MCSTNIAMCTHAVQCLQKWMSAMKVQSTDTDLESTQAFIGSWIIHSNWYLQRQENTTQKNCCHGDGLKWLIAEKSETELSESEFEYLCVSVCVSVCVCGGEECVCEWGAKHVCRQALYVHVAHLFSGDQMKNAECAGISFNSDLGSNWMVPT